MAYGNETSVISHGSGSEGIGINGGIGVDKTSIEGWGGE